jgi:hypothetical protein
MLRTAFIERSIGCASDVEETDVIGLAPIVDSNVWVGNPLLKGSRAAGGGNYWVTMWGIARPPARDQCA